MKLLYISTLDHIVRVMLPHLDGAREAGYETHVACQFTRFKDDIAPHADSLHHVPIQRNPLDPRNLVALFALIKIIRKLQPDIVHCHNPSGGFIGRLAATIARTGAKRAYTAHGFHFHPLGGKLSNALYRFIEGFAGRFLSDAVLTINQWDFEEAQKLMPPERVHFTHGVGVSTDEFDPVTVTPEERQAIRDEFGVPEDGLLISCIGELIPRKNQELLLWAIADQTAMGAISDQVRLVFVGDGVLLDSLKQLARKLNIEAQVYFAGFRWDTKAILATSDLFAFPSLQEGLPCSVQEALCMEVPVMCCPVRGCADMVDSDCGVVVTILNSCMVWTIQMFDLLMLPVAQRKALGRVGRQRMIEHYSRPICVAEWLAIYEKLSPILPSASSLPSLSRYREGGAGGGRETGGRENQP